MKFALRLPLFYARAYNKNGAYPLLYRNTEENLMHAWITVLGIVFTFLTTALGAAVVFLFKGEISPKLNAVFLVNDCEIAVGICTLYSVSVADIAILKRS